MPVHRWTLVVTAWFLVISSAAAQDSKLPDPLFQSNDVLEVRLTAPIRALIVDRPFEEELLGSLRFEDADGQLVDIDLKVRTRGKFRRDRKNCLFPPLRLNLKKSQVKGTLFNKQHKLKLVTHCELSGKYEQALLKEYVAYRVLNVMTDISFRVRLLKITYVDSEGERDDDTRYAFLIEHKKRLAKRIDKSILKVPHTHVFRIPSLRVVSVCTPTAQV